MYWFRGNICWANFNKQTSYVWCFSIAYSRSYALYLQIFQGNMNTYMAELREVNPPIIGKKLRFVPYSTHPRTICMRVEVYGCAWKGISIVSFYTKRLGVVSCTLFVPWSYQIIESNFDFLLLKYWVSILKSIHL